jgi:hypothetical protein
LGRNWKFSTVTRRRLFRAVLGGPGIVGEPSFQEDRPALGEELVNVLGHPAKRTAIDEARFVTLAAVLSRPAAIRRQSEVDYRRLVRRVRQLRVAR